MMFSNIPLFSSPKSFGRSLFVDDDFVGSAGSIAGRTPSPVSSGVTWQGTGSEIDGSGSAFQSGCFINVGTPDFTSEVLMLLPNGGNLLGKCFNTTTKRTFVQHFNNVMRIYEHLEPSYHERGAAADVVSYDTDQTITLTYSGRSMSAQRTGSSSIASGTLNDAQVYNSTHCYAMEGGTTERKRRIKIYR